LSHDIGVQSLPSIADLPSAYNRLDLSQINACWFILVCRVANVDGQAPALRFLLGHVAWSCACSPPVIHLGSVRDLLAEWSASTEETEVP
jgi:hypothetical protein